MFTEAKLLSRLTHLVNACIINIFLMIQDPLRTIFSIYIYIFFFKKTQKAFLESSITADLDYPGE